MRQQQTKTSEGQIHIRGIHHPDIADKEDRAFLSSKPVDINTELKVTGPSSANSAESALSEKEIIEIIKAYFDSHAGYSVLEKKVIKIGQDYEHNQKRVSYRSR